MSKPALSTPSLLREAAYVGGVWLPAGGNAIAVTNPANGTLIGHVPDVDDATLNAAIETAQTAQKHWAAQPPRNRARILLRWHGLVKQHAPDLALLLTTEQGKPLAEAAAEIDYAASFIEWFAEEAPRISGEMPSSTLAGQRLLVLRQPSGVVAAITPWNFPAAMVTRKIAPALAAGCAVLLKPSELTPFTALALAALAEEAGLPAGILSVVTGDAKRIGECFTVHPAIRKLSFTGSTRTGKWLMAQSASTVKRLSLELGGNAPFIVFDDADIPAAAKALMASKFRNSGQTCVCTNRILVQEGVHEAFVATLTPLVEALKPGIGTEAGVTQGTLISTAAKAKVETLLHDALAKGAQQHGAAHPLPASGHFVSPALLTGVTPQMQLFHEEIFGPIAAITRFRDEAEAVRLANATPYGLAAYFFTQNHTRIWRVSEALEYGMVGVNEGLIATAAAPFGGVKESGFGREGSIHGIEEYLDMKYVCVGGLG